MRQCINLSLFVNKHFAKRVRFVINSSRQRDFLSTILRNLALNFAMYMLFYNLYYHFLRIAIELFLPSHGSSIESVLSLFQPTLHLEQIW